MRGVTICMPPTRAVSGVGGPSTAGVSSSVGGSSVTGHGPRFGLMSGVSGLRISILNGQRPFGQSHHHQPSRPASIRRLNAAARPPATTPSRGSSWPTPQRGGEGGGGKEGGEGAEGGDGGGEGGSGGSLGGGGEGEGGDHHQRP